MRGVQRVIVAGISGSGKTTFARELAVRAALPYHEMDALYHGPNWVPIDTFEDDVAAIVARERWVFDSHGYEQVRDLMWARADTVVWLDYSRPVVMARVLRRSFHRAATRRPMFNGNTETFRRWLDPEHPVQWAWTQYDARRQDMLRRFADPANAHLHRVVFTRPDQARAWLATIRP